jgi:hypothetical protein
MKKHDSSDEQPKNDDQTPEPIYHESENFVSAYFGEVPEQLKKKAGKKDDKNLMATIVSLISDPRNQELRHETLVLLRNNDARELLVTMLGMKEYRKYRKELAAACWESGLDFSPYLAAFTGILADQTLDNETQLELLTVIEEMQGPFLPETVEKALTDLGSWPQNHAFHPMVSTIHRKFSEL